MAEEIIDYTKELKEYLHIETTEDDSNLNRMLTTAHATLKRWCGQFELSDEEGKGLVFDYVRYMRAGASEYFLANFRTQINSFGLSLMPTPMDEVTEDG